MLASAAKSAGDPDVQALAARIAPAIDRLLKAAQRMGSAGDGAQAPTRLAGTGAGQ